MMNSQECKSNENARVALQVADPLDDNDKFV